MSTIHSEFARRAARIERVIVRLSPDERRLLEQLARTSKATISDLLRDGLAHVCQRAGERTRHFTAREIELMPIYDVEPDGRAFEIEAPDTRALEHAGEVGDLR